MVLLGLEWSEVGISSLSLGFGFNGIGTGGVDSVVGCPTVGCRVSVKYCCTIECRVIVTGNG